MVSEVLCAQSAMVEWYTKWVPTSCHPSKYLETVMPIYNTPIYVYFQVNYAIKIICPAEYFKYSTPGNITTDVLCIGLFHCQVTFL